MKLICLLLIEISRSVIYLSFSYAGKYVIRINNQYKLENLDTINNINRMIFELGHNDGIMYSIQRNSNCLDLHGAYF